VQAEEGVVGEHAVAARGGHQVAGEGGGRCVVDAAQNGGGPMYQLLHVAAHPIQRQVIRHLHFAPNLPQRVRHLAAVHTPLRGTPVLPGCTAT